MNLVVVSNRVARVRANEPMTGGLAAALLPVVEKSGAIWVGSSGRVRDGLHKDSFAEVEAMGAGALALLDLPGGTLRRVLRRLRQLGAVAGTSFQIRSDSRVAGRLSVVPRGQCLHGASFDAVPQAGYCILDSGLSLSVAGCGVARSRRQASDRFLLAYPVASPRRSSALFRIIAN